MITSGVLLIPVIVCLICNLAVGQGLDWFFWNHHTIKSNIDAILVATCIIAGIGLMIAGCILGKKKK